MPARDDAAASSISSIPPPLLQLLDDLGAASRDHSGDSLLAHLSGVHELLRAWGEPEPVAVAGLFHSIYGTEWYRVETAPMDRRAAIADRVGAEAEELAFLFCVCDRAAIWTDAPALTDRRDGTALPISPAVRRNLMHIDVANTVEQLRRGAGGERPILERFERRLTAFAGQLSAPALAAARETIRSYPGIEAGRCLADLVAPLTPDEFNRDFWGVRPAYIPAGGKRFSHLLTLDRLRDLLRQKDLSVRASFDGGRSQIHVLAREAWSLFEAGATLCINDIETADGDLRALAAAVRRELNMLGRADIRCYLSPEGKGYDIHWDARIATTLQLEGSKRWRFSRETALAWPHYQVRSGPRQSLTTDYVFHNPPEDWERFRPPAECVFDEAVLMPGDVLCLPAGTWHAAAAEGYSLALNLAFEPLSTWDFLAPILGSSMQRLESWRGPLPCAPADGIRPGELPDAVRAHCAARLREMADAVEALGANGDALCHAWRRSLVFPEDARIRPVPPAGDLTPTQRLRMTRRGVLTYGFGPGRGGKRAVYLYSDNPPAEIVYSAEAEAFFRTLIEQQEFVAEDARAWTGDGSMFSWEGARTILEDLLAHGLIEKT